jgi:hypothetical protein
VSVKQFVLSGIGCIPNVGAVRMPGYRLVEERFVVFEQELPTVCRARQLHVQDLTFRERRTLVSEWSARNQRATQESRGRHGLWGGEGAT